MKYYVNAMKFVVGIGLNACMQSNIINVVPLKFSGKSKGHVKKR